MWKNDHACVASAPPVWIFAFRLIPLLLIVGILWTGYQVAQGLVQRIGEQNEAAQPPAALRADRDRAGSQPRHPGAGRESRRDRAGGVSPHDDLALQFETNTPLPPQATAARDQHADADTRRSHAAPAADAVPVTAATRQGRARAARRSHRPCRRSIGMATIC